MSGFWNIYVNFVSKILDIYKCFNPLVMAGGVVWGYFLSSKINPISSCKEGFSPRKSLLHKGL